MKLLILIDLLSAFLYVRHIEKGAKIVENFVNYAGDGGISERDKYISSVIPELPSIAYCENRFSI